MIISKKANKLSGPSSVSLKRIVHTDRDVVVVVGYEIRLTP